MVTLVFITMVSITMVSFYCWVLFSLQKTNKACLVSPKHSLCDESYWTRIRIALEFVMKGINNVVRVFFFLLLLIWYLDIVKYQSKQKQKILRQISVVFSFLVSLFLNKSMEALIQWFIKNTWIISFHRNGWVNNSTTDSFFALS